MSFVCFIHFHFVLKGHGHGHSHSHIAKSKVEDNQIDLMHDNNSCSTMQLVNSIQFNSIDI